MDKLLLEPIAHFNQITRGREFHALLWHAFNFWFEVPPGEIKADLSHILKELTIVTVSMDDLMDYSKKRRGIIVTNLVYGAPMTIYGLIFKIIEMLERMIKYNKLKILEEYIVMGMDSFRGQGFELYFTRNVICPTEREYSEVITYKATSAIYFSLQLLQAFSKKYQTTDFYKLMDFVGQFYQIHNDYRGLEPKIHETGRVFAEDITEGKFILPFIHSVRTHPEDKQIIDVLRQRTTDEKIKQHFLQLIEKYGSLDYTWQTLRNLVKSCVEEMEIVGRNPDLVKVLNSALDDIDTTLTF